MRALFVLALLAGPAAAAPPATPSDPEPPRPKPSLELRVPAGVPEAALAPIAAKWWTQPNPCPAKTRLTMTKRKGGEREVFCARGKQKHGPYARLVIPDEDLTADVPEHFEYVAEQGRFLGGVRQGLWTTGYMEWEKTAVYFVNGLREGVERSGRDGFRDELMEPVKIEMQSYLHDVLEGPSERHDDDGNVTAVESYHQGKKDGRWLLFKHGRRIEEQNWASGVASGRFARWDDSGKLISSTELVDGTGTLVEWMWDGSKSRETAYVKGVEDGPFKRWLGGKLAEEGNHAHGELEGPSTSYRLDGSKEWQGPYVAGQKRGEWVHWTADGRENARGHYRAGSREGVWLIDGHTLAYNKKGRVIAVDGVKPVAAEVARLESPQD